ncbi:ASCH domain-containing protein [Pelobium sp.]|nr:ASCH domain-containing protein [Pelobium sp.]MDA9554652.1 ASCH domain-containing protein [Pelobium sp.]
MKWKDKVFNIVLQSLENEKNWDDIKEKLKSGRNDFGVHVGIFAEPYLTLIIEGKKTIESRFSVNKISPYGRIFNGDLVLVKKAGGSIVGMFIAGDVKFHSRLNVSKLKDLESKYGKQICTEVNPDFWVNRKESKFATLIDITRFKEIKPFTINKSDRTAWSIVQNRLLSLFDN